MVHRDRSDDYLNLFLIVGKLRQMLLKCATTIFSDALLSIQYGGV